MNRGFDMREKRRRRDQGGNAMLEFALAGTVLIPIFLGMVWGGISLGRGIQITQITRDTAHMYAKNIDFTKNYNKDIVVRLALGTNMTRDGGQGVMVLSQIMKIHQADCDAAGLSASDCTNRDHNVFVHRVTIGNTSLTDGASRYGNPAVVNPDGSVPSYLTESGARANNFDPDPGNPAGGRMALAQGEVAYVAEGYLSAPDITFTTGEAGIYAVSVF